jgi:hypothetical protein
LLVVGVLGDVLLLDDQMGVDVDPSLGVITANPF